MKNVKKILVATFLFIMLMAECAYAYTPKWEELPGNYAPSVLSQETESENAINVIARGKYFSTGILRITNEQDGTLYISADTSAHINVDKIYQTIFLDKWDDDREDWVQIGYWEFERAKEEEDDGTLSAYHIGFTVTGCELNHYYRARAMHLVQWGDHYEGKATETNGVLLTDHEV